MHDARGQLMRPLLPTGVKWLWELHTQRAGGIIGDEMGADVTLMSVSSMTEIQIFSIIAKALHHLHCLFAPRRPHHMSALCGIRHAS